MQLQDQESGKAQDQAASPVKDLRLEERAHGFLRRYLVPIGITRQTQLTYTVARFRDYANFNHI